ncbi:MULTISPECIES: class I SAM-dependent methyltransferase [Pseudomonas]|uniref:Phosphatidylethanolamine N-methyltransferase n=1 Tax=Pseudomonas oryzihabitans TaxID=47885 RepID=A0A178LJZ8_9PSED|nr:MULTISPECIES: class I SAM-dependent methyltransferase [Pseudomonas]KXJ31411.1 phosphatidylethanolamine N-methyltransferase [Pseudomonas sp. HUK17]MDC7831197.1 class I SAM-dependent methyltransferase [Pseudomonas benzopyrenica]MXS17460.1 methyltransferase domain-containing protein [Pseudomonas oryzihabitans]NRH40776.1 class I SAM-dependent methyltransferase [Pseudomonas sp. MS15a(2019)]OAN30420.1 phosphatidylethanolamine N-methyltransferase [Pseudomonas oryzihabitans]
MHDSKKIDYSLDTADTSAPHSALDNAAIISAYRRWANVYDRVFGGVSAPGRKRAVAAVNALAGTRVLEVGVGTGLALPHYGADKRVTGIDLSPDMLAKARERVARDEITTVEALLEANAEETGLPTGSFDIAVAMFVASVVPNPRKLMQEMRRVVKPGGHLLLVNHFQAESGLRLLAEKTLAPASRKLGWHPDFAMDSILSREDLRRASRSSVPPFGLFTLVQLTND